MVCEEKVFCFTRQEAAARFNMTQKAFHHFIHSSAEAYLVRVNHVRKTTSGRLEIELNTTVDEVIEGSKQKGETFIFWRLHDAPEGLQRWINNLPGTSQYVFLTEVAPGQFGVDAQAPTDMWEAKKAFRPLLAFHRQNCISQ